MLRTIPYFFILLAGLLLPGCSHDTDTFDGPNLVERFGDFQVLDEFTSSQNSVDFAAGETVTFTARFNKRVNFIVRITGLESGAVKEFSGFDSELNETNALWEGGTSALPLFREEVCNVQLLVSEEDYMSDDLEVEILGRKVYDATLITDFETDPLDNIIFGNFEFELTNNTGRRNDGNAAEGDWYYYFEGTDDVVSNFFVGLIDIKASIVGETYFPVPTTVPEDLYFNTFIQADGGLHGIAVIQFIYDSNDSGEFEDGVDAVFQIEGDYPLNWVGWRHFHHPMSDVGMTPDQLSKIVAVRLLLISDMNSQPSPPLQVDYGIDFLNFTAGGPLKL